MRDITIQMLTERGKVVSLSASARRKVPRNADGTPIKPVPTEVFPLVVTPVSVPWFNKTAARGTGSYKIQTDRALGEDLGDAPHILFAGLAFLSQLQLTIDTDTMRMTILDADGSPAGSTQGNKSPPEDPSKYFRGKSMYAS